jgi:hypothetical protein
MEKIIITAATPMIIPKIVKKDRSLAAIKFWYEILIAGNNIFNKKTKHQLINNKSNPNYPMNFNLSFDLNLIFGL